MAEQKTFMQTLRLKGAGVLDARAKNTYAATKIEADRQVELRKSEVLKIKAEISEHQDVSITNTQSLKVGVPSDWVEKELELQEALYSATLKYSIAVKWRDAMFPPDEEDVETPEIELLNV